MLQKSELPLQGFKREKMQNTPQIPLCARQSCGGESAAACQGQHGTVPPLWNIFSLEPGDPFISTLETGIL